jgi:hypothetical protein
VGNVGGDVLLFSLDGGAFHAALPPTDRPVTAMAFSPAEPKGDQVLLVTVKQAIRCPAASNHGEAGEADDNGEAGHRLPSHR